MNKLKKYIKSNLWLGLYIIVATILFIYYSSLKLQNQDI